MTYAWDMLAPSPEPAPRVGALMAYDEARQEVLMFGGFGRSVDFGLTGLSDETWVWDGSWTQKAPTHSPPGRQLGGCAWSPANNGVVIFSGILDVDDNDTWLWDGTDWTQLFPAHAPSTRDGAGMATAPGIGNVLLTCGFTAALGVSDTWLWDGTDWLVQSPAHHPSSRYDVACAYDRANGKVTLYGGGSGIASYDETWIWGGSDWTQEAPVTLPGGRRNGGLAYLACAEKLLLWGGSYPGLGGAHGTESWLWDGAAHNWEQVLPDTNPAGQLYPSLCGDEARNNIVYLNGDDSPTVAPFVGGETWIFRCVDTLRHLVVTTEPHMIPLRNPHMSVA